MTSQQKTYLFGGIILLIAIIISFFLGMHFQARRNLFYSARFNPMMGYRQKMMFREGFTMRHGLSGRRGLTNGQIVGVSQNQITVKLSNGQTQTINFTSNTTFIKIEQANQNDLKTGATVSVVGSGDTSGSISAQSIRINLLPTPTP